MSMLRTGIAALLIVGLGAAAFGCGGSSEPTRRRRTASSSGGATEEIDDHQRCNTDGEDLEVSEYDTSGDESPDVRRVFHRIGEGGLARLVLTCREADLNGDGVKDVVRFYNEEGRPLREESDRDFDGAIDTITVFQNGRVVRTELDENADGRVDAKIYYDEDGVATRTERDIAGRSTADTWHPDRWEYYEDGRMVRMGTDIDGDGRVDRWDRDGDRAPEPGGGAASSSAGAGSAGT